MSDVEVEVDCTQQGALIRRLDLSTLVVTGKDRLTWLNGLVTCDLAAKKPGDGAYGLVVAKNGKILSEVYVLVGDADLWVGLPAGKAEALVQHLDKHLIMEDVSLELASGRDGWSCALGPRAAEAMVAARAAAGRAGLSARGGLAAAVIAAPTESVAAIERAVIDAVKPSCVASAEGWERVRVEHGIVEYGVDFDDTSYPQEASLERDAVSFAKGCYLGQETVFMLEKRGHVSKKIVQLMVEGPVAPNDAITTAEGAAVGAITSAITRPGFNLALGRVKYKYAKKDTALLVGTSKAHVTALLAVVEEPDS
jgi:hypothetical protein